MVCPDGEEVFWGWVPEPTWETSLSFSLIQDDPLSALDVHVGSHVFQKAIVGTLLRKKQTVVLVTHQLQYLHHAHKVVVNQNPPKFK